MTRFKPDFKSRFRILKGGKVSLVISAMLIGSMVNVVNAVEIDDVRTEFYDFRGGQTENLIITPNGYATTSNAIPAILIQSPLNKEYKIENQGTISVDAKSSRVITSSSTIYGSIINKGTIVETHTLGHANA